MIDSNERVLDSPVGPRDHRRGPDTARVRLIQYGDYQCEDCGAAYPVLREIQEAMGDSLQFVFRNFPLNHEHAHAQQAAEAAEAAAFQGKFWEMHDALYENQDAVRAGDILSIAALTGVDIVQMKADLESRRFQPIVDDDHRGGVRSGVDSTPTFFIDNRRCDIGEDYALLRPILQRAARNEE